MKVVLGVALWVTCPVIFIHGYTQCQCKAYNDKTTTKAGASTIEIPMTLILPHRELPCVFIFKFSKCRVTSLEQN
jgi:hypothetical protein